jgi:hypothetical protein
MLKKSHCKPATKWFRPQLIRFWVNDFLHQKGIKAQLVDENDESEIKFEPRVSAGNGIAGNIKGFEYRILKMLNGGLPPPVTETRKEYYNNQKRLESYFQVNTIYLWKLNKYTVELYLAIPKRPYLYAQTDIQLIPNPITLLKQKDTEGLSKSNDVIEVKNINDLRRTNKTSS